MTEKGIKTVIDLFNQGNKFKKNEPPSVEEFIDLLKKELQPNDISDKPENMDDAAKTIAINAHKALFYQPIAEAAKSILVLLVNGKHILNAIKEKFPHLKGFINKMDTKSIRALLGDEEEAEDGNNGGYKERIREYIIKQQKNSLLTLLSAEDEEFVKSTIRDPFIKYVEEKKGAEDVKYITDHFKIIRCSKPKITFQTTHESHYTKFEDTYRDTFKYFMLNAGRNKLDYEMIKGEATSTNSKKLTDTHNNKPTVRKGSLTAKTDLTHNWNTFVGEKFKETVIDLVLKKKNIHIEGESGSGKTHFLEGLAHEIHRIKPEEDVIYMTGSQFYYEYQALSKELRDQNNQTQNQNNPTQNPTQNHTQRKGKKTTSYEPTFTDKFINKIVILDNIDFIFAGRVTDRPKSKETLIKMMQSAKQIIFSGRTPIGTLLLPPKGENDKPVGLSEEVKNIIPIEMPEHIPQSKKTIIYNIFAEHGDLFSSEPALPIESIANMLIEHVSPNNYEMIIGGYCTAIKLDPAHPISMKKYIENKLNKEITLSPEEIISEIHELLVCEDDIRNTLPEVSWNDIDGGKPKEIIKNVGNMNVHRNSGLGVFMELITYFISEQHRKLSQLDIGAIINKPAGVSPLYRRAEARKKQNPKLFTLISAGLEKAIYKKYDLKSEKKAAENPDQKQIT